AVLVEGARLNPGPLAASDEGMVGPRPMRQRRVLRRDEDMLATEPRLYLLCKLRCLALPRLPLLAPRRLRLDDVPQTSVDWYATLTMILCHVAADNQFAAVPVDVGKGETCQLLFAKPCHEICVPDVTPRLRAALEEPGHFVGRQGPAFLRPIME